MADDTSNVETSDDEVEMTGSIAHNFMAIMGVLLALMVANAGFGIYQMGKIGEEIMEIAEHDLPLTNIVSKVTNRQIEQAVTLERALRLGVEMETDMAARRLLDETTAHFGELTCGNISLSKEHSNVR